MATTRKQQPAKKQTRLTTLNAGAARPAAAKQPPRKWFPVVDPQHRTNGRQMPRSAGYLLKRQCVLKRQCDQRPQ
jgi:hypothetical protein